MLLKDVDVVILCGGLGKRLRGIIKNRPKPMALINGRSFLDYLIFYLVKFGFRRFILCTGYKKSSIKRYYAKRYKNFEFVFSEENVPLGTGGAVKNAKKFIWKVIL